MPQIQGLTNGEKLAEVKYISKCTSEEKSLSNIEANETSILLRGNYDLDPLIFYRLNESLKEGVELPSIELTEYYELS